MKAVEHDFLFSEKAITKRLSMKKAPKLTLKPLEVKGGKSKAQKAKAKAKKQYKEMMTKAKENFELASANSHKLAQQKLANQLSGLKIKLRQAEDKILAQGNIAKQ